MDTAISNWVSKVIQDYIRIALLRFVIVRKKLAQLKAITTWSPAFCRALGSFVDFTLSSHWLFKVFFFLLIGHCDYSGFGFTTLHRERSIKENGFLLTLAWSWNISLCTTGSFNSVYALHTSLRQTNSSNLSERPGTDLCLTRQRGIMIKWMKIITWLDSRRKDELWVGSLILCHISEHLCFSTGCKCVS